MQNSFVAKDQAVSFLESATCRLKRGGYFIGSLPDSSAIWLAFTPQTILILNLRYNAQKQAMKDLEKAKKQKIKVRKTDKAATIKGSLYSIEFHDDFKNLGTSYTYKMAGSDADIIEYMVPPSCFLP